MLKKDEWTQQELFEYTIELKKQNIEVVLVDTILKPLEKIKTITYNPFEMQKYPKNTVFVFYCDTGKTTKERLGFYRKKLLGYKCISLRGGKAYWRPNYQIFKK